MLRPQQLRWRHPLQQRRLTLQLHGWQPGARRHRCAAAAAAGDAAVEHVPVVITGAGIAGTAAAVALHKVGVPVMVLERAPGLRQEGSALALWSNAWRALDVLGVGQQLRGDSLLLDRLEFVSPDRLLRRFTLAECIAPGAAPGQTDDEMRGVMRTQLLEVLAAQLPDGALRFNSAAVSVSESAGVAGRTLLKLADGRTVSCDVLVGADGANSIVAKVLGLPAPSYAGYIAYRGVSEFPQGNLPMPANTIRQMFGAGVRAGMYPITERNTYWFVTFNAPEDAPRPADAAGNLADALGAVQGWGWGIRESIQATPAERISRGLVRDRWTAGAFGRGAITLAGDAAHPMTPNLGQGGCTAIEDSIALARHLGPLLRSSGGGGGAAPSDPGALADALRAYERERTARTLPLTVRAFLFGALLQLPYAPVVAARNLFLEKGFKPGSFLDHTRYDIGQLANGSLPA